MTSIPQYTDLNERTVELLTSVGLPMLSRQFHHARRDDESLLKNLLLGHTINACHQPEADRYCWDLWLNNPRWNRLDADALALFLVLVAERLATDEAFRRLIAEELVRPAAYASQSLRPLPAQDVGAMRQFSLMLQLR